MLARWPLLHIIAMAGVATLVAATFWTGMTQYVTPLLAAAFAIPPAIVLLRAPREPGEARNKAYALAWVLLAGMLLIYTFYSSTAL